VFSQILNAYRSPSRLDRPELFVGLIILTVATGILASALGALYPSANDALLYLCLQAGWALAAMPLAVARLRDLGWKPHFAILISIPLLFNPALAALFASEAGASAATGWMLLLGPPALFTCVFFMLTLLFWKGKDT
jgi:hypothetical protein